MKTDTIYTGDCLKVMASWPENSVDMVLCDLPYGTTRNAWDSVIDLDELWKHYKRVVKDNGAIVLFAQSPFSHTLAASNMAMLRYDWVWEKAQATGFLNAKKMPLKAHENNLVFYSKLPTYNPQKTTGHPRKVSTAAHKRNSKRTTNYGEHGLTTYDSTERYPRSVLKFPTDHQKSRLHPTQKPVALCEYLINTYTNPGELVLDNTIGSGSTAVAALATRRHYVGIEEDAEMAELARQRVAEFVVAQAVAGPSV